MSTLWASPVAARDYDTGWPYEIRLERINMSLSVSSLFYVSENADVVTSYQPLLLYDEKCMPFDVAAEVFDLSK